MEDKNDEGMSNEQSTSNASDKAPTITTTANELQPSVCTVTATSTQMEIENTSIESTNQRSSGDSINVSISQQKESPEQQAQIQQKLDATEPANLEQGNATSTTENTNLMETETTVSVQADLDQHMDSTKNISHPVVEAQTKIKKEQYDDKLHSDESESFATVVVKSEQSTRHLVGAQNFITRSSLGLLAEYDSDSDEDANGNQKQCHEEDEVVEVPIEATKDYRSKVVEIDSESDSESSSSDSDVEYITKLRKEIEKQIDLEDDEDAEDDDEEEGTAGKNKKKKTQSSMRVKGELGLEDLPPIEDLHITVPEEECIVLGKVHSIVDQLLLVSALPDSTLYDLDTVLFLDKGKRVLGVIFDVLGQVADPLYCVRFNSHKDIEDKSIKVGDAVYVAPKTEHTQFVIMSNLMKMRGSDASWENDIEPPPRYLDYSDDEQEREARQRLRNKDRSVNKDYDDHDDAAKRIRDDPDETASVVSAASSSEQTQAMHSQRGRRFNRGNAHRPTYNDNRQRFNNQRSPQQMPRNPNSGSWHSNYHRPYAYNRPHMAMPPMPMPMNPSYAPFPQYPHFTPTMPPPMYVPNPYAMRPPQLSQHIPPLPMKGRSPSPPPPGLD